MSRNIQDRNVGNLGDILKHAAELALAPLMPAGTNYVETNAYLLESKIPDAQEWEIETGRLVSDFPSYINYQELEEPLVDFGLYLCSPGVALKAFTQPRLSLAENNPTTNKKLKKQLEDRSVHANLVDEMSLLGNLSEPGPLFMLVDPFAETQDDWNQIWTAAKGAKQALWDQDCPFILELFYYHKGKEGPVFPPPLPGTVGPIATISRGPHHLATYCNRSMTDQVSSSLLLLGWTVDSI